MTEQWQELKETITEMRDNDGTGTQQDVCRFLVNYMGVLEKQMHEPKTGHWIPVSEKLPKPFTFVNATCRSLVDDRENWVVETVYVPIPKEVNKHGYSDWGNIPMLNWGEAEVVAWVERIIPQPYKADVEPQEREDKEK